MQNAFRILKPIQKSSKCVSVFRSTGANAFAKIQMRLAYEDKRDLYCKFEECVIIIMYIYIYYISYVVLWDANCLLIHVFSLKLLEIKVNSFFIQSYSKFTSFYKSAKIVINIFKKN